MSDQNHEETVDFTRAQVEQSLEGVGGRQVIGTLDNGLISGYVEMVIAESAYNEIHEHIKLRMMQHSAGAYVDHGGNVQAVMHDMLRHNIFDTEGEAAEYFHKFAMHQELYWSFWNRLRMTFNTWNSAISIRKGWSVVFLGKKVDKG